MYGVEQNEIFFSYLFISVPAIVWLEINHGNGDRGNFTENIKINIYI